MAAPARFALADLPVRVAAAAGLAGYTAPGVPGGVLSVIGAPQISDDGMVLATCRVAGPGIVFSGNDLALMSFDRYGHGRLLGRTGIENATGVLGTTFSATFFPRLSKDGAVAAVGFLSGTGVDTSNSTGYWRGDRQSIGLSIRSGQFEVPGVPGAAFYGFVGGFPCNISRAGLAFGAQLSVGVGGVTINDFQGLWGPSSGGGIELVARPGVVGAIGAPPASLPGTAYLRTNLKSLVLADNGSLAFQATLAAGGLGVTDANDTLIVVRRADGTLDVAAREGMGVPGYPGVVLRSLDTSAFVGAGGLDMNSAEWLAFGDIDAANLPIAGVSRLWRKSPSGNWTLLAAVDLATPAGNQIGSGGIFDTILAPAMSSGGATVFAATATSLLGGSISGLWNVDASGTITLIAASGLTGSLYSPPGAPGTAFAAEAPVGGSYRINARGQILFRWKLQDGVGGATTDTDDGLWAWDPGAGLIKVARSGDTVMVNGSPEVIRSINTFFGPSGDDDGRIMNLNALGEVAFVAQFTDNTGALLVAQLPGAGACCRGARCAVESSAACSGTATRFAGVGTTCQGGSVGACCAADFDQSGELGAADIFAFLNAWLAGNLNADANASGRLEPADIFDFINIWYHGC